MAQSYTRQSTFADGDTITAALFNDEYNQLLNAFAYSNTSASSTGHRHDGTAGEGGNIHTIGDLDFLNKIVVDSTNNRWGFYVEVSSAAVEQIRIQDGAMLPVTDSDVDLGTSSLYWKDAYIDSVTTTGNISIGGNLTVTGNATISGNLTFGNADTDSITITADVASHITPDTDDTYDLGSSTKEWRDIYIDGTAYLDAINFNGTAITSTAAELNILDGVTATATEINLLDGVTATTAELNYLDITTLGTVEASKAVTADSNADVLFGDDDKLKFGADSDLQIYYDSTNDYSYLHDTSTQLRLRGPIISLRSANDNVPYLTAASTGVTLTHGGSTKLTTNSSGIDVTGTAEMDTLSIGGTAVTSTAAELNILDGVTATAAELNVLDGVTAFVDEDDMSSDSATSIPSQQSVKAYVDSQVASADTLAELTDTNVTTPADGALLFYDTATSKWIDNVVSGDITIADTGVAAIGSGVIVNADVNASAAIDVSKTALTAGTGLTLTTNTLSVDAAQTQITSVGTLSSLSVSGSLTLGGTAITSTAAELNILDGVTATATELNILDGVTATTAELNILDGVTSTATELNILDGVTSTTAELNILDGVTSTATELNILDGVTATTAELNYLDITTLGLTEASKAVTADDNGVVNFDFGTTDDVNTITSSSNAFTINLRLGNVWEHDLTENVTYTFSNPGASGTATAFVLKVIQDSTARTITWPTSVDWPAGTAPTLTTTNNGVDVFVFFTIDGGTTYYGFTAGQAMG